MFRLCSALMLLGLAGPASAQIAGTSAWTLASGDYTIFGHTRYTPTVVLLPRVVYDTTHRMDSALVVDSVRQAAPAPVGFAAGLSGWPADFYCGGATSATMQSVEPRALIARLQLAARCGVRLVIVPPRRMITADGRTGGVFSPDSARRLTDRFAAVLPADSIRKYRATILGFNLADDYTCAACWGGTPVTQAEIAEWADYVRARLPGVPLGVRVEPQWVARWPALAPKVDYAWAQYQTRKGDPRVYFDTAAGVAGKLGLRLVMGVNVEHCYGPDTDPCSAADLTRFGMVAVSHPASCGFINWKYQEARWADPAIRSAWDGLLAAARARAPEECRRAGAA